MLMNANSNPPFTKSLDPPVPSDVTDLYHGPKRIEHGLRQKITTSGEVFMEITIEQFDWSTCNSHGTMLVSCQHITCGANFLCSDP